MRTNIDIPHSLHGKIADLAEQTKERAEEVLDFDSEQG